MNNIRTSKKIDAKPHFVFIAKDSSEGSLIATPNIFTGYVIALHQVGDKDRIKLARKLRNYSAARLSEIEDHDQVKEMRRWLSSNS